MQSKKDYMLAKKKKSDKNHKRIGKRMGTGKAQNNASKSGLVSSSTRLSKKPQPKRAERCTIKNDWGGGKKNRGTELQLEQIRNQKTDHVGAGGRKRQQVGKKVVKWPVHRPIWVSKGARKGPVCESGKLPM